MTEPSLDLQAYYSVTGIKITWTSKPKQKVHIVGRQIKLVSLLSWIVFYSRCKTFFIRVVPVSYCRSSYLLKTRAGQNITDLSNGDVLASNGAAKNTKSYKRNQETRIYIDVPKCTRGQRYAGTKFKKCCIRFCEKCSFIWKAEKHRMTQDHSQPINEDGNRVLEKSNATQGYMGC